MGGKIRGLLARLDLHKTSLAITASVADEMNRLLLEPDTSSLFAIIEECGGPVDVADAFTPAVVIVVPALVILTDILRKINSPVFYPPSVASLSRQAAALRPVLVEVARSPSAAHTHELLLVDICRTLRQVANALAKVDVNPEGGWEYFWNIDSVRTIVDGSAGCISQWHAALTASTASLTTTFSVNAMAVEAGN